MKYANIIYNDLVNTDGVSLTFFVQGCSHHCRGCFSKNTWDFNGGKEFTEDIKTQLEYVIKNYNYDYLCFIGGEPLDNIELCKIVMNIFNKANKYPKIWIYTGYTMDEICSDFIKNNFIQTADVLITGRFEEDKYDPTLLFKGSKNQKRWIKNEQIWEVVD